MLARTVSLGIDALNKVAATQELQRAANAGDQAVFKQLNDSMNQGLDAQSVPLVWRALFP
jgi:hypothetical protein